jgi:type IV pilus assembly protein PilC
MKFTVQTQLFSRVSFLDKLLFTKHLALMIKSGITIVEAITILEDQTKSSAFKELLLKILADIQNGKSFAKSLEKHPSVFNVFYVSLINIGEESGTLDENLVYLAKQLAKEYAFRKEIRGAMMYPLIVLSAAAIIGMGISLFVLPQLINLFTGFDVQLPLATRILLWFAQTMRDYGIIIVLGILGFIIFLRFFVNTKVVKPFWHWTLLSFPIFGQMVQNVELSMLTRSLGIMIKSGLPIGTSLEIEANMSSNIIFNNYSKRMLSGITRGHSLSQELASHYYTKIPGIVVKMIAVGEETGKLDETLLYLADFFEEEVEDTAKNISTLLEPVMLLGIGLVVAFIAFAIISPIYQLTGSIK